MAFLYSIALCSQQSEDTVVVNLLHVHLGLPFPSERERERGRPSFTTRDLASASADMFSPFVWTSLAISLGAVCCQPTGDSNLLLSFIIINRPLFFYSSGTASSTGANADDAASSSSYASGPKYGKRMQLLVHQMRA